jgi:DNA polymerase iota
LYKFIEAYTWNGKVERLGFDEVWLNVTDMIDYNVDILNRNDLEHSFFQISQEDPTLGFVFDASVVAGNTYPREFEFPGDAFDVDAVALRLRLGSHLAMYMRHQLEQQKGYTATVGVATNKLLAKLVGNLHKPKDQTTLMPGPDGRNCMTFIGTHEIGKVPGIGFKLAQKLREFILNRPAEIDTGLVYGGTKENVTVEVVRRYPEVNPETLEKLLAGSGSQHGIGQKVWCLLHGIDDSEVSQMRTVPRQISIEDSYIRLDTLPEVVKVLNTLAQSLLKRMRVDLLGDEDGFGEQSTRVDAGATEEPKAILLEGKKWLAHPKTLRLTTRPRQALLPDGTRPRSFKRISHSAPLPTFVFLLHESVEILADKLVKESLIGMFRKLHPEKAGWNLSLVNLAVTNMAETAGNSKTAKGRDIGNMFRRQGDVLREFRVVDDGDVGALVDGGSMGTPVEEEVADGLAVDLNVEEQASDDEEETNDDEWDDGGNEDGEACDLCGVRLPGFAMVAHRRFHSLP